MLTIYSHSASGCGFTLLVSLFIPLQFGLLYSSAFGRTAAVMGNRRDIPDKGDPESGGRYGAHGRLPAGTWSFHINADSAHPIVLSLFGGRLGRDLGRERS